MSMWERIKERAERKIAKNNERIAKHHAIGNSHSLRLIAEIEADNEYQRERLWQAEEQLKHAEVEC